MEKLFPCFPVITVQMGKLILCFGNWAGFVTKLLIHFIHYITSLFFCRCDPKILHLRCRVTSGVRANISRAIPTQGTSVFGLNYKALTGKQVYDLRIHSKFAISRCGECFFSFANDRYNVIAFEQCAEWRRYVCLKVKNFKYLPFSSTPFELLVSIVIYSNCYVFFLNPTEF